MLGIAVDSFANLVKGERERKSDFLLLRFFVFSFFKKIKKVYVENKRHRAQKEREHMKKKRMKNSNIREGKKKERKKKL